MLGVSLIIEEEVRSMYKERTDPSYKCGSSIYIVNELIGTNRSLLNLYFKPYFV